MPNPLDAHVSLGLSLGWKSGPLHAVFSSASLDVSRAFKHFPGPAQFSPFNFHALLRQWGLRAHQAVTSRAFSLSPRLSPWSYRRGEGVSTALPWCMRGGCLKRSLSPAHTYCKTVSLSSADIKCVSQHSAAGASAPGRSPEGFSPLSPLGS